MMMIVHLLINQVQKPVSPIHIVIGRCVHCFQLAYTVDINNNKSCFPCAYDSAN